ncbi:MAG: hypothetical protein FWC91_06885 [Defluviitaleaceae bacterium]|nr:hypothetical protein [Defluviitaleaceae bacterium]
MDRKKGKVIPLDPALRRQQQKRRPRPRSDNVTRNAPKRKNTGLQTGSIQEYKRAKSINRSTAFVAGLFFLFVLIYLIQTLFIFFNTPEIPVEMVQLGSISAPVIIEGIIIRDETVYTANRNGFVQFYVNNFSRVRPQERVASIQNIGAVTHIREYISNAEENILGTIRGNQSAADPNIQRINTQIRNLMDQRLSRNIRLNMAEVYALRDTIVQHVDIRNQMIFNNLESNAWAEQNINYRFLNDQLDANLSYIRINNGGIMTSIVDGFENYLTFDNMYYLTREETRQNVDFDQIFHRREIAFGDDAFKIVNSNRWYIAAYIPNELVENFETGDMYNIFIEGRREPLDVHIHHMVPGIQETFVIFRSTRYMLDFLETRSIFFRTTDVLQRGLMVANTAIIEREYLMIPLPAIHEGNREYVILVNDSGDRQIHVVVTDSDDYYAFVPTHHASNLGVGSVLRNSFDPETTIIISDERIVQGAFRVNTGIAAFVAIHLSENTPVNERYTILDPVLNIGSLRLNDHIVTDASQVEDGDIVFSRVR